MHLNFAGDRDVQWSEHLKDCKEIVQLFSFGGPEDFYIIIQVHFIFLILLISSPLILFVRACPSLFSLYVGNKEKKFTPRYDKTLFVMNIS